MIGKEFVKFEGVGVTYGARADKTQALVPD